jgi:4-amino-4-deoxy-L-arabinose transferase-like glycosyltransferase
LLVTSARFVVAASAPISPDEAYYWIWSRVLTAGYLDHPPMVALWIRAGTLLAGNTALGVRLLGPVSALVGTLLLVKAAEDFWPGRSAGGIAACTLNATPALNALSVVMTPDTPLLFFWSASLFALGRVMRTERPVWWLAFGLCAGFALDSKYTAVLLGLGVLLWVVASPPSRRWLTCWQFYAGGGLALICFLPVLGWNAAHAWASFAKQGGRTESLIAVGAGRFLFELLAGQVALATPILAVMFATGMGRAARGFRDSESHALLACTCFVPAVVFLQHALGARVQANWPGIIYPGAALAAAALAPRFWRQGVALGGVLSGIVLLQAAAAPLPLPRWADFTLIRLAGWQDLAGEVFAAERRNGADCVVADEYGLASELAFRLRGAVASTETDRWRLFDLPSMSLAGRTCLFVLSDRSRNEPNPHAWPSATLIGRVERGRGGAVAETYRLYRVVGGTAALGIRLPAQHAVRGELAAN